MSMVLSFLSSVLHRAANAADWVLDVAEAGVHAAPSYHSSLSFLAHTQRYQLVLAGAILAAIILGTKRLLRWPVLLCIILFLSCELCVYFLVRWLVFLLERILFLPASKRSPAARLKAAMKHVDTYEQWERLAAEADVVLGIEPWKRVDESRYYNAKLLNKLMQEMQASMHSKDVMRLTSALQSSLHKNVGGLMNEHLYSKSLVGTKYLIDQFIDTVVQSIQWLTELGLQKSTMDSDGCASNVVEAAPSHTSNGRVSRRMKSSRSPAGRAPTSTSTRRRSTSRTGRRSTRSTAAVTPSSPTPQHHHRHHNLTVDSALSGPSLLQPADLQTPCSLLNFFLSSKRQFGCTALCLSGGASLGNYHWGCVKALLEAGMLPRIISGTSSGAVVAALVGTRTDEELYDVLRPEVLAPQLTSFDESWIKVATRFIKKRVMYEQKNWIEKLQFFANSDAIPNMTFLEAYQRTGRVLSITCTSQRKHNPSMLLNHLTTPHLCIATAILASAAVPGFIQPVVLMEKVNGSIRPYHDRDLQWCDGSLQRDLPLAELSEQFGVNFFIVVQVNPHIAPFFFNPRGASGQPSIFRRRTGGYRGGFLLAALELLLKEDMKKNLKVLNELELLPSLFGGDFSYLFLQGFEGQITLVPHITLRDYMHIICDPSVKDLERFFLEGRRTAWRKFSMIKKRMTVGNAINQAIRTLRERVMRMDEEINPSSRHNDDGHVSASSNLKQHAMQRNSMDRRNGWLNNMPFGEDAELFSPFLQHSSSNHAR